MCYALNFNTKNEYSYFRSDLGNNTAVLHFRLTHDMQISLLLIIQTIRLFKNIFYKVQCCAL